MEDIVWMRSGEINAGGATGLRVRMRADILRLRRRDAGVHEGEDVAAWLVMNKTAASRAHQASLLPASSNNPVASYSAHKTATSCKRTMLRSSDNSVASRRK